MRTIFLICLLLLSNIPLFSQSVFSIQLNQPSYFSEDLIFGKIITDLKLKGEADIFLVDGSGNCIANQKVLIDTENGYDYLNIKIPFIKEDCLLRMYFAISDYTASSLFPVFSKVRKNEQSEEEKSQVVISPEGGFLLAGIESKVSYRFSQRAIKPSEIQILDKGSEIKKRVFPKNNVGTFSFSPSVGQGYFFKALFPNGENVIGQIPVKQDGILVNFIGLENRHANFKVYSTKTGRVKVRLTTLNNSILSEGEADILNGTGLVSLDVKNSFGVILKSVWNNGQSSSERLIFVERDAFSPIFSVSDSSNYGESIKITFTKEFIDTYLPNKSTISIIDTRQVIDPLDKLSSDYQRAFFNGGFNFISTNPLTNEEIQSELATVGSSDSVIEKNRSNSSSELDLEVELINGEEKLDYSYVSLSIPSIKYINYQLTDAAGKTTFKVPSLIGYRTAFISPLIWGDALQKDLIINSSLVGNVISQECYKDFLPLEDSAFYIDKENSFFKDIYYISQVSEGYFSEFEAASIDDTSVSYSTDLRLPHYDKIYNLQEYVIFKSIKELFKEAISFVNFKKDEFRVFSTELRRNFSQKPLVIIDGIPTLNTEFLLNLDPQNIAYVQVINRISTIQKYGNIAANGMIGITTLTGINTEKLPGSDKIFLEGFKPTNNSIKLDGSTESYNLPSTIYWGDLTALEEGNTLTIKPGDQRTDYLIIVQGVNKKGIPFFQTQKIKYQ